MSKKLNLFQIKIILVNSLTWAFNFMIRRLPSSLNIFTRKMKDVMFIFLYHIIALHFPEYVKQ